MTQVYGRVMSVGLLSKCLAEPPETGKNQRSLGKMQQCSAGCQTALACEAD